jgi:radical SAM protein with 4Fe4S-binding SPASM domain
MDCPQDELQPQTTFFDRLHAAAAEKRIPVSGSLELTLRCNLRCAHCYVGDARSGLPDQRDLSTAEFFNILDQVTDGGCMWLQLTGGEPLARPDFLEIYTYARRKGLILNFFTNATLLTPRLADALAEMPPHMTEVTLYGNTAQTYERVTGIPGSYARCRRGIELLLQRGFPLKLKTMALSLNHQELQGMKDFAASLGVSFRFDPLLFSALDGGQDPRSLRLSPQEVLQHDLEDPERMAGWRELAGRYAGRPRADTRHLYVCGAGKNTFHIDPYGRLFPCIISRSESYDLRQGSFAEGWETFMGQQRAREVVGERRCSRCSLMPLCGQCPGWAVLENNDPQQPVDYLCQIAHLRAKNIGWIE